MIEPDPPICGSILIYVAGYRVNDWRCMELNDGHHFENPDADDPLRHLESWAVGDNPRDRYCSIHSPKIRHFKDIEVAADYIEKKQRKRKSEQFTIMYELGNFRHQVKTLEDILAIDAAAAVEKRELDRLRAEEKAKFLAEYPGIDVLRPLYGMGTAMKCCELLGILRADGEKAARQRFSSSTFYRLRRLLVAANILEK